MVILGLPILSGLLRRNLLRFGRLSDSALIKEPTQSQLAGIIFLDETNRYTRRVSLGTVCCSNNRRYRFLMANSRENYLPVGSITSY
jgi:hypothetical protein